ncbi:DRTGG domain-containing protein [Caminicella sporogenes DSM 14501]|uniref:DRTGG domain-containing protein n=1 Tax=Caminicella sporogenes DSM 14501 TaxID=1121266 RepID=A0A1M6LXQ2_9FIRM|nr:DRTGG domain-containing protein [Caminicella sporogenes]RKD27990.1 AraC family transcriptional regulator [Caminicella sporogenes]WIF94407.1 DRTGG domain-containing protein [Caminicella sporogenes]SHJ75979.1 DRTGG domain-containing protein [Caminicella sporogenes DSM 14501]
MLVKDAVEKFGFKLLAGNKSLNKEISGLYYCDLLSWVMSHAKEGNAWITVQTHLNIVAVASLIDLACIIIPEAIEVDEETLKKADEVGIPILSTELDSFNIFSKFYEAGMR